MTLYERKLSICFFTAALLLGVAMTAFASDAPYFPLASPVCNSGWQLAQRYDERRADGVIVRTQWISRCIPQPKVKWHKRNRQLTRRT